MPSQGVYSNGLRRGNVLVLRVGRVDVDEVCKMQASSESFQRDGGKGRPNAVLERLLELLQMSPILPWSMPILPPSLPRQ